MEKNCKNCGNGFRVEERDVAFYERVSPTFGGRSFAIPVPTLCPDCRQQRRLAVTNQMKLYRRTCDATGVEMVTNIRSGSPHKVYHQAHWWNDKWNPLAYGREFDFSRPFFEQWYELSLAVPRPSLTTTYQRDENSPYTNFCADSKDCYFIFDSDHCHETYYSYSMNTTVNCLECYRVRNSELCVGCIDCRQCYNSRFLENSYQCRDSAFLSNCVGCEKCFMCTNVQHKKYYAFNQPVSPDEYERLMRSLGSFSAINEYAEKFEAMKKEAIAKYYHGKQNEDISGGHLSHCKNVHDSWDSDDARDCRYLYQSFGVSIKDLMDCDQCGEFSELLYECSNVGYTMFHVLFSMQMLESGRDVFYSDHCFQNCENLFGCIGLRKKKYCILNKQYTKEEYESLVPRIIEHMVSTGEWGEFFPLWCSTFAYNESHAMFYYPLTRDEAIVKGVRWYDSPESVSGVSFSSLPDDVRFSGEDVSTQIFVCVGCNKPYKIIKQELKLYRDLDVALPRMCFECRHKLRLAKRNPRHLWNRECAKCGVGFSTSYSPDRPEKVYCEKCYLEEVY